MRAACAMLVEKNVSYTNVETDVWLSEIDKLESEGMYFVDVKAKDKKSRKSGSVIAAAVFCGLMFLVEVLFIWAFLSDPAGAPPLPIFAIFVAVPLVFAAAAVVALMQRLKEIERGEEDAASKY